MLLAASSSLALPMGKLSEDNLSPRFEEMLRNFKLRLTFNRLEMVEFIL